MEIRVSAHSLYHTTVRREVATCNREHHTKGPYMSLPNAVAMIKEDHRRVESLYQDYQRLDGQPAEQRPVVEHICHDLEIHAKLEWFNPFGSVKDRPAWEMLRDLEERGEVGGQRGLVEPTNAGSTFGTHVPRRSPSA